MIRSKFNGKLSRIAGDIQVPKSNSTISSYTYTCTTAASSACFSCASCNTCSC